MHSNHYPSYLRVDTVSVNDDHSKALANALVRVVVSRSRKVNGIDRPPVHPILSLPPELISLIFIHCLPPYAELRASKAPLLLTRICGAWRALALRTPALWASVAFKLFHDASVSTNPTPHELKFRKLTWWLAQGAAHPLTLNLHCHTQHPAVVPLLLEHAARWADADIFLHPSTLTAFSAAAESGSGSTSALELPLLRRLSLGCWPLRFKADADSERTLPVITAFANAPRLTHVSLLKLPLSAVVLPWTQLTNLFASCASVDDVSRVLRLAPSLQHLQLDFRDWPASGPQTSAESEDEVESSDIVHESLTSLTLHTHPALVVPLSVLLGGALPALPLPLPSPSPLAGASGAQLTLPSLTSLSLPPLAPTDVSTLVAFAARSRLGDTLRELTLPITPLARGTILAVLGPLKSLEKLELRFPGEVVLEDILGALGPAVTPDAIMECSADDAEIDIDADGQNDDEKLDLAHVPFLPCLRELHADCFRGRVPYALLRAALEARWGVETDVSSSSSIASSDEDATCVDVPVAVAQLRSFTVTTLSPSPKPATPSGSSYFSFWLSSSSLPEEPRLQFDADTDAVHIAALQALKAQGMDVNVAWSQRISSRVDRYTSLNLRHRTLLFGATNRVPAAHCTNGASTKAAASVGTFIDLKHAGMRRNPSPPVVDVWNDAWFRCFSERRSGLCDPDVLYESRLGDSDVADAVSRLLISPTATLFLRGMQFVDEVSAAE
ncbi:F-box domain-containing protein [Mycena sanguinolenta]|uniref:F-box domain-containing protein n=1 Tax=Mycena sanguinolenta TaxID=230812 RepID=A0A8H6Y4V5_9AGAR|nr:F-box domain-containing protein [Mycena sanguinolenta]